MEPYNVDLISAPFGLQNTGVLCYFNSFLQALCACSSFTNAVIKNREYLSKTRTGLSIIDFVDNYVTLNSSISTSSQQILRALCTDLKERRPNTPFGSGQESAHEVFILLLDMMEDPTKSLNNGVISSIESPITKLFLHKGMWNSFCKNCNKVVSKDVDYGVIFDMHHLDNASPATPPDFSSLIRQHSSVVSDYRCEQCNFKGDSLRFYDLRRIPEIIFCSFNVYQEYGGKKYKRYIPLHLEFPSSEVGKKLIFKQVSQIEHSGSLFGGHYWAYSLRKDGKVYLLNDSQVSQCEGFQSTRDTYIVVYHLV